MIECYLGLGANQQDPARVLHQAKNQLQKLEKTQIGICAPIIQTEPFGILGQPIFYNQVIQIWTHLTPQQLLEKIHRIEKKLGRIRNLAWGPRKIDIDILIYGKTQQQNQTLTLPHPQIWERPFVSRQLQDINTSLIQYFYQNSIPRKHLKHAILVPKIK